MFIYIYQFIFIPLNLSFPESFQYKGAYLALEIISVIALFLDLILNLIAYHKLKGKVDIQNKITPSESK